MLHGDICLVHDAREVTVCGERVELTKTEYEILLCLMSRGGEVVSKWAIVNTVWGLEPVTHDTLKVHICNLRKKIGCCRIVSVYGKGYMLVP